MRKTTALLAVAAFGLGGLVAAYALRSPDRPVERAMGGGVPAPWSVVALTFPLYLWGKGKAFRC